MEAVEADVVRYTGELNCDTAIDKELITSDEQPKADSNIKSGISVASSKLIQDTEDTGIQPSSSIGTEVEANTPTQMDPDASDEIPEVDDSLGLLAESSKMVEEEDDQDDDEDDDDDDEQDVEGNQLNIEYSEDSSAHQSEDNKECDMQMSPDATNPENALDGFNDAAETTDDDTGTATMKIDNVSSLKIEDESLSEIEEMPTLRLEDESLSETEEMPTLKLEDESLLEIEEMPTLKIEEISSLNISEHDIQLSTEEVLKDKNKEEEVNSELADPETIKKPPESEHDVLSEPEAMETDDVSLPETNDAVNIKDSAKTPEETDEKVENESSQNIDIQEVKKKSTENKESVEDISSDTDKETPTTGEAKKTSVNLPKDIDVMSTSTGDTSEIVAKADETIINNIPTPAPPKMARINTSEVSIKTASSTPEPTLVIPETKAQESTTDENSSPTKEKRPFQSPKFSLEVFNLDSDDEDTLKRAADTIPLAPKKLSAVELQKARDTNRCINYLCTSIGKSDVQYQPAPGFVWSYFELKRTKRVELVCQTCFDQVARRMQGMINGVKDMSPLMQLDVEKQCLELVEISDSDSDSDLDESMAKEEDIIGAKCATFLEDNLANIINDVWSAYKLDERIKSAKSELDEELLKMEKEHAEIDALLNNCQASTDNVRNELYATFADKIQEMEPVEFVDMPPSQMFLTSVTSDLSSGASDKENRRSMRQRKSVNQSEVVTNANKNVAIPLGYLDTMKSNAIGQDNDSSLNKQDIDDNADIAVVKLSAEVAPAGLPPPGVVDRPALQVGDAIYVLRHTFGTWVRAKVIEVVATNNPSFGDFSLYKVRLDYVKKGDNQKVEKSAGVKQVNGRYVAYSEPAPVRLSIGTRVIALFKDTINTMKRDSFYSGIVAEIPTPVNNFRYLVFFDDGYAQYVHHENARVVCESSPRVWEDVHPDSREFVRKYLLAYPERPMVRLHAGQSLKTEWNGKWWISKVLSVDASLAQVYFESDNRTEWIYRGSTRLAPLFLELQAAERRSQNQRPRTFLRSNKTQAHTQNMPYVEYLRSDEQDNKATTDVQHEDLKRQRAVAKKSTMSSHLPQTHQPAPAPVQVPLDNVISRVVYYTPKAAVKPLKMTPHTCTPRCKRTDVLPLKELRTYNPLARPLLSGWERQVLRFKGRKVVMYRAPCGRRLRNISELHRYLRIIQSDMSVDLFDYGPATHCLAEFVLNRCNVSKKDLSHGKESVPVPCVNYYDSSLPEFCSYSTERTPTAGVPLNTDPEFLCGCDCIDDCQDKSKCACWKMTLEGAKTIGMEGDEVGYIYKRLLQPLTSGIYECNVRCKCRDTCLNRVAQHPLQLKLQVFKTLNRGWGIRALNDVPRGAFLCIYAGNLLTDATANLDGVNEGDEYLAELDYIEVVEKLKEGYESDVAERERKRNKKKGADGESSGSDDEEGNTSSEDEQKKGSEDVDFRPGFDVGPLAYEFKKHLRKRNKNKDGSDDKEDENGDDREKQKENAEDDCITISDDEEVREPSRFTAQAGLDDEDLVSKHRSVRSYFGRDEACYIMDAKVQGNIGRYLNHSCSPNVFVQNVFVDTHDPRFPWVAFFAASHIRAGTELTWNYNYDIGSVPDKVMYCKCGAPNCRGRLL